MIEWIKQFRTIHLFIALIVGTVFNVGVMSATMPKARDFAVEREARAAMGDRLTRVEEHGRQDDIERADMRSRFDGLEKLIIGIAIQVGAPVPKK
jgi:hypothetical protein